MELQQEKNMKKTILTGNEAIAYGILNSGCLCATAYPGTPSSEILGTIFKIKEKINPDLYAEWSVNEKVALETAIGAAIAGLRAVCCMKQVGLNVAADPLFTSSYTGINAGLVVITADEPGIHSSQTEQDNRGYGFLAKLPVLEPSCAQEAMEFIEKAFEISEEFDTPVILRLTTRICHTQGVVCVQEFKTPLKRKYNKNPQKYILIPSFARKRKEAVLKRMNELQRESLKFAHIIEGDQKAGVIGSGVAILNAMEVLPHATFLKLDMPFPVSPGLFEEFASKVDLIFIVEENDPIIEMQVPPSLYNKIKIYGKSLFPENGELTPEKIAIAVQPILENKFTLRIPEKSPVKFHNKYRSVRRPPLLCPGCSHRGLAYVFKKMKLNVMGDIGCYGISGIPPYGNFDAVLCMGASINLMHGFNIAQKRLNSTSNSGNSLKTVAFIGDSTFFHSGLTGLLNMTICKGNGVIVVTDNMITGMTGHQPTASTPLMENKEGIKIERIAEIFNADYVKTINPYDPVEIEAQITKALGIEGVSVLVARGPCIRVAGNIDSPYEVDSNLCKGCKLCLKIYCPAIEFKNGKASIIEFFCAGCGLCANICPFKAILKKAEK